MNASVVLLAVMVAIVTGLVVASASQNTSTTIAFRCRPTPARLQMGRGGSRIYEALKLDLPYDVCQVSGGNQDLQLP